MPEEKRDYASLVGLEEVSQLKADLNRGVASLEAADKNWFRPHICINEMDGVKVLQQIARDPENAKTAFRLVNHLNYGGGSDLWLNIGFMVSLNEPSTGSMVRLSPRQTAYIIANLPEDSKKIVVEKIRDWYFDYFLKRIQEAIDYITKQFNREDFFLADDYRNRILDIHDTEGVRSKPDWDVPYTEWDIVGSELFGKFFFGHTLFQHEQDGYDRIDAMLRVMDQQRLSAIDAVMNLVRGFKG